MGQTSLLGTTSKRSCANAYKIVQIKVPGLLGAQPKESLDRLMRAAAMRLGRAWEEVPSDTALKCAQWQHCLDLEGNVSGRIFLCLESPAEAEQVKTSLAGAVVSLGAEPRLLSIEHLVHSSKNGVPGRGSQSHGRAQNAGSNAKNNRQ